MLSKEAADALNEEAFADRYHRAFPIESPASVYVSNAYFMHKRAAMEDKWGANLVNEVEARINTAAELFKISEDLQTYNASLNEKTAADYSENWLTTIDGYELFPFKTAADLSYQAESFAKDIKQYPFGWRAKIASEFVSAAAEHNVDDLPDLICKYAGFYFPDTREFSTELTRRMNKISSEKAKEQYQQCIEKSSGIATRDDAMNICAEAYAIEKSAGVYDNNNLYSQLGDIVDKTFQLDIEKIASLLNVVKMDGEPYSVTDLQKVSKDIYKQAFGCDIDPTKQAELHDVLPTMPGSDVALFRELSGVSPL